MTENEREVPEPQPGRASPEGDSRSETADAPINLDIPAFVVMDSLRSRLAQIERLGDPEASAVASECKALLDAIGRELDAIRKK